MATLEDLFSYVAIDRVISTVRDKDRRMANFYGLLPGQANTDQFPGRQFGWDRFDVTRLIAQGRSPGSAAAQVDLNPVGSVMATAYRVAEETHLDIERVFRRRGVGLDMGNVDARGERYVALQMQHKMRRAFDMREFMVNRFLVEGGFKIVVNGNDRIPKPLSDATPGAITVNAQHPAANKLTLGDWSLAGTNIIDALWSVNRASERDSRYPIRVCWINSTTARNIQNNTQVQATAGSANVWFNELGFTPTFNDRGQMTPGTTFVLRGYPHMVFHVYDDFFATDDGATIDAIPDGVAVFTPNPDPEWLEYREGSEFVQRQIGAEPVEQFGFGMWQQFVGNPVAIAMFSVDNGIVAPYVPNAWYIGDITQ